MQMIKSTLGIAGALLGTSLALAQVPQIISIGPEEYVGPNGRLSTITTDARGQPHIASDKGAMCYFYDKIGGAWRSSSFNAGSRGSSQFYEPHLEIDNNDIGWCSGSLFGGQQGLGFLIRTSMSSGPSGMAYSQRNYKPSGGMMGNLSLDLTKGIAVCWASERYWGTFYFDGSASGWNRTIATGKMYCGVGGEANSLWVSRAGMQLHNDGTTHSVWHVATAANAGWGYSMAQNSLRFSKGLGSIPWAYGGAYGGMGTDGCHVRTVGDNRKPETAYIAVDISNDGGAGGIWGNVVDGKSAVRPVNNILCIDRTGRTGLRRYAPDMAPAKKGGAYVVWQNTGRIKIRYVSQRGAMGPIVDICPGTCAAIHCDAQGNLHIAYLTTGIRYRKILVAGGGSETTLAGDFVGDYHHDLCVFDSSTRSWHIYNQLNPVDSRTFRWGSIGSSPVPGNFLGGAKTELTAFDPMTATWYIYDIETGNTRAIKWGYAGVTPLAGDFIGDSHDDLVAYDPATYMWYIYDVQTGTTFSHKWGNPSTLPITGNFIGMAKDDLAAYDSANFTWHFGDIQTGKTRDVVWGPSSGAAVNGNYIGDIHDDLASYDLMTGKWYILDINNPAGLVSRVVNFGFAGAVPVRGNYFDTGYSELSLFNPANGRWYIYNLQKDMAPIFGNIAWGSSDMIPIGSAN